MTNRALVDQAVTELRRGGWDAADVSEERGHDAVRVPEQDHQRLMSVEKIVFNLDARARRLED